MNNTNNNSISTIEDRLQKLQSRIETVMKRPSNTNDNTCQGTEISHQSSKYEQKSAHNAYSKAFVNYLRNGSEQGLKNIINLEHKSLFASQNTANTGYAITTQMYEDINQQLIHASPMRRISNVMQITSDSLEIFNKNGKFATTWSEEEITKSKSGIALQKTQIDIKDLYAQPKITQRLLDDPKISIEKWISDELLEVFAQSENEAFINGDGKKQPQGLITSAKNEHIIHSNKRLSLDDLIKLYYALDDQYVTNAKFLMHRSTIEKIFPIKDKNDQPVSNPQIISKENGKTTLFGLEVIVSNDMPKYNSNGIIIAFGDFKKGYQIIDRDNITVLRDPYTEKPFVKFYSHKKVGGGVTNESAIKFLKI